MYVFIAGPMMRGDLVKNIAKAMETADAVLRLGHTPFLPHLCSFWDLKCPRDQESWRAYSLKWLEKCDCLLRLDGDSEGADLEVAFATNRGIPVYTETEFFMQPLEKEYVPLPFHVRSHEEGAALRLTLLEGE